MAGKQPVVTSGHQGGAQPLCPSLGQGLPPKLSPQAGLGGLWPVPQWHGDIPAHSPAVVPGWLRSPQGKARVTRRHPPGRSPLGSGHAEHASSHSGHKGHLSHVWSKARRRGTCRGATVSLTECSWRRQRDLKLIQRKFGRGRGKFSFTESWGSPLVLPLLLTRSRAGLTLRLGPPGTETLWGNGDPPSGNSPSMGGPEGKNSRHTSEEQKRTRTGLYFKMLIYFLFFFYPFFFFFFSFSFFFSQF